MYLRGLAVAIDGGAGPVLGTGLLPAADDGIGSDVELPGNADAVSVSRTSAAGGRAERGRISIAGKEADLRPQSDMADGVRQPVPSKGLENQAA